MVRNRVKHQNCSPYLSVQILSTWRNLASTNTPLVNLKQIRRAASSGEARVGAEEAKLECVRWTLELSTGLREIAQCPEKAPASAISLFKAPASSFTIKNTLRHYAKISRSPVGNSRLSGGLETVELWSCELITQSIMPPGLNNVC